MTAISRSSYQTPIHKMVTLATADDLDGINDTTQAFDITGALRYLIFSEIGTPGTAGIDIIGISHDGGLTWAADDTLLLLTANDTTGTIVASTGLEAAGVEPITIATQIWKGGPQVGPTAIACFRDTDGYAALGTDWVTGAPGVYMVMIGGTVTSAANDVPATLS